MIMQRSTPQSVTPAFRRRAGPASGRSRTAAGPSLRPACTGPARQPLRRTMTLSSVQQNLPRDAPARKGCQSSPYATGRGFLTYPKFSGARSAFMNAVLQDCALEPYTVAASWRAAVLRGPRAGPRGPRPSRIGSQGNPLRGGGRWMSTSETKCVAHGHLRTIRPTSRPASVPGRLARRVPHTRAFALAIVGARTIHSAGDCTDRK